MNQSWGKQCQWRAVIGLSLLSALGGCAELFDETRAEVAESREKAEQQVAEFGAGEGSARSVVVAVADDGREDIPQRWQVAGAIVMERRDGMSLAAVMGRLEAITGLDVVYLAGIEGGRGVPRDEARVSGYSGSLGEVLDRVAARHDLAWRYVDGIVEFREYVSRTYRMAALPMRMEVAGNVSDASSAASIDLVDEMRRTLEVLAGPDSVVDFAPGAGTVTVVARPDRQRRVGEHVQALNRRLSRRIAFDVNILTVSGVRSASQGVNLGFLIGDRAGDYVAVDGGGSAAGSSLNVGLVEGDLDLDAVVQALEQQGEVTVETRGGATTADNRVAPVQVVRRVSYARTVETGRDSGGELRTTIEPGTITTGFEMTLLPRLLDDGGILLRYNVQLSELDDIKEFTTDRQTIQLPELSTMSFEHETVLRDRQTLVLAGFERQRASFDQSRSFAGLFGLRRTASRERVSTVLTIRPRLLPMIGRARR